VTGPVIPVAVEADQLRQNPALRRGQRGDKNTSAGSTRAQLAGRMSRLIAGALCLCIAGQYRTSWSRSSAARPAPGMVSEDDGGDQVGAAMTVAAAILSQVVPSIPAQATRDSCGSGPPAA
jgi:hypothetical protein